MYRRTYFLISVLLLIYGDFGANSFPVNPPKAIPKSGFGEEIQHETPQTLSEKLPKTREIITVNTASTEPAPDSNNSDPDNQLDTRGVRKAAGRFWNAIGPNRRRKSAPQSPYPTNYVSKMVNEPTQPVTGVHRPGDISVKHDTPSVDQLNYKLRVPRDTRGKEGYLTDQEIHCMNKSCLCCCVPFLHKIPHKKRNSKEATRTVSNSTNRRTDTGY